MFDIKLGKPEVNDFWYNLKVKVDNKTANKDEIKKYKKIGNTFKKISDNPKHPGLNSHEIKALSKRYGMKVLNHM